jgi:uncharacterized protein (UPF0332 family)
VTPDVWDQWLRALRTLSTAGSLVETDPDSAASRAYYAAFYAVGTLFAFEGRTFRKHTAIEAAVHRDLVKAGRCSQEVGAAFSSLSKARAVADYGSGVHMTAADAREAVARATSILEAVRKMSPEALPDHL